VVNVIVLWNTIYMDAALNQLRAVAFDVHDEDIARLSPLRFDYINMLGRYAFILLDQLARGELRPLRDPQNTMRELKCSFGSVASVMGPWSSSSECIQSPVSCFCPWSA
jgi:hypothetical protein